MRPSPGFRGPDSDSSSYSTTATTLHSAVAVTACRLQAPQATTTSPRVHRRRRLAPEHRRADSHLDIFQDPPTCARYDRQVLSPSVSSKGTDLTFQAYIARAPAISPTPQPRAAGRETSMKLGCGCGPIAPMRSVVAREDEFFRQRSSGTARLARCLDARRLSISGFYRQRVLTALGPR